MLCNQFQLQRVSEPCACSNLSLKAYRGHWVKCDPSCHARTGGICGRSVLPAFPMWKSYLKEFLVRPACHNRFRMFHHTKVISWQDFATCVAEIMVGGQHVDNQIIFADIPRYKTFKHRWIFTRSKNLWSHKPNHWSSWLKPPWSLLQREPGQTPVPRWNTQKITWIPRKKKHSGWEHQGIHWFQSLELFPLFVGSRNHAVNKMLIELQVVRWESADLFGTEDNRMISALLSDDIKHLLILNADPDYWSSMLFNCGGVHFSIMFYHCWCNPILKQIAKTELERQIEVKVDKGRSIPFIVAFLRVAEAFW